MAQSVDRITHLYESAVLARPLAERNPLLTLELAERIASVTVILAADTPTEVLSSAERNPLGRRLRFVTRAFLERFPGLEEQMRNDYAVWEKLIHELHEEDEISGRTNHPTAGAVMKALNSLIFSRIEEFATVGGIRALSEHINSTEEDLREVPAIQQALRVYGISDIQLLFVIYAFRPQRAS